MDFRIEGREVSIRRLGDGVLLEPLKVEEWPDGYFESIRIDDPEFGRPEQGELLQEFTSMRSDPPGLRG